MDHSKKIVWVLGWRPKHPYLCTLSARKGGCLIPGMGVFEMDNAKKYCLGSGVAPRTHTPLQTIRQKRCFWVPGMVVFELHNAKKYCLGSGVAPQTLLPLYPTG